MKSSSLNELLLQHMQAAGSLEGNKLSDPYITQIKYSSIHRRPQQQKEDIKSPVKAKEGPRGDHKVTFDEKQVKTNAKLPERTKENVDVKARKGQATDVRGLPEKPAIRPAERRVRRRAKTSELKKFQQDLVPASNKVNGKAKMLDYQIINYEESLQVQADKEGAKSPVKAKEEPKGDAKNRVGKTQAKTNTKTPEPDKDFIHVCAASRRNIQAERIQRESNGEGMKILQDPEPSSDKKEDIKGLLKAKAEPKGGAKVTSDEKQARTNTNPPEHPKENVDVRAIRGQASDIHGRVERVRLRTKFSKRMKFLQDLVPGCNKVSGRVEVLDEIIKYIQSLQLQLATRDNKKEPLLGLTETQNSHYIDIEEDNSIKDHETHNKNDVVDTRKDNFDASATHPLLETKISIPLLPETESHDEAYHTRDDSSQEVNQIERDDTNPRIGTLTSTKYNNRTDVGHLRTNYRKKVTFSRILVIGAFIFEVLSAIFEQLSSPSNSLFALIALVASFVAIVPCLIEIICKCRQEQVTWRRSGRIYWFCYPNGKSFGSFKDIFGFVCGTLQFISVAISYAFYCRHVNSPIKLSLCPLVFALCMMSSNFCGGQDKEDSE